ncbi:sensor histidine kinase, partial [Nitrolancea hollandica]|uniref:sensor histidine kinase n=1 Tax=Nitrolancea hollandica TaxID=1206749 RepID=UPI000688AEB1
MAKEHPLRPNSSRWVIVAMAVAALIGLGQMSLAATQHQPSLGLRAKAVDGHLIVTWVQPAGLAWDAGIRPGDLIIGIDGQPTSPLDDLATLATASTVHAQSVSGAEMVASGVSAVTISEQRQLSFLTIAVSFVVVPSIIYVLAADVTAARAILGFGMAAAVMLLAAIATPFGTTWALGVEYIAVVSFGATTFLLFLVFPINHMLTPWGRRVTKSCLALVAILVICYIWVVVVDPAAYQPLQRVGLAALVAQFMGAGVLVIAAALKTSARQRQAQRALGLVALGAIAGLAPFCLLALTPRLLGLGYLVRPDVAILSVVLLPVSLGVAILSRQFFGITRILRRGLIALVIWIGLIGIYSAALDIMLEAGAKIDILAPVAASTVLSVALIAGTFGPVQQWLRRALERLLFRDVYSYAATLQDLSNEIVHQGNVETIASHFLSRLGQTLDLSWTAIILNDAYATVRYSWGDCPRSVDLDRLAGATFGSRHGLEVAASADLAQLVPLLIEGVPIGTMAIGPKRRDIELLQEDRTLITTLAPLVATTLQNALLIRRLESQVAALEDREQALAALSTKLLRVQEEERRRLALDLHDDPLQRAVLLARELNEAPHCSHRQLIGAAEEIIISLRAICTGLRPPVLDDLGLAAGLNRLLHEVEARSDLSTSLLVETTDHAPFKRLEPDLEIALYRVAQEALNNCLKHARATQVTVSVCQSSSRVRLNVADDGQGLDRSNGSETGPP